ncbi:MAG: hypothetical protein EBY15_08915 [Gammaproteobacteria bacterium]|nr:hypothetical protein [Gammaproteobacteria bacterium]
MLIAVTGLPGASAAEADVTPSSAQEAENVAETKPSEKKAPKSYSFFEAMGKSIWGDVYAHPEDWQEKGFFTD